MDNSWFVSPLSLPSLVNSKIFRELETFFYLSFALLVIGKAKFQNAYIKRPHPTFNVILVFFVGEVTWRFLRNDLNGEGHCGLKLTLKDNMNRLHCDLFIFLYPLRRLRCTISSQK